MEKRLKQMFNASEVPVIGEVVYEKKISKLYSDCKREDRLLQIVRLDHQAQMFIEFGKNFCESCGDVIKSDRQIYVTRFIKPKQVGVNGDRSPDIRYDIEYDYLCSDACKDAYIFNLKLKE